MDVVHRTDLVCRLDLELQWLRISGRFGAVTIDVIRQYFFAKVIHMFAMLGLFACFLWAQGMAIVLLELAVPSLVLNLYLSVALSILVYAKLKPGWWKLERPS